MATQTGIDAVVKLGDVTIADMATWSFTDTKAPISAPVFGEEFNKVHGMGIRNVTGSVTGYLNTTDSTGQVAIQTAYEAGTPLSDFRVYINDTKYWKGTSVYISNFNTSASAEDAVIPISFDFTASENWALT
jgi:hypothetical protein